MKLNKCTSVLMCYHVTHPFIGLDLFFSIFRQSVPDNGIRDVCQCDTGYVRDTNSVKCIRLAACASDEKSIQDFHSNLKLYSLCLMYNKCSYFPSFRNNKWHTYVMYCIIMLQYEFSAKAKRR